MSTTTSSKRLTLMASTALLMATVVIRDTNCSTTSSHQPTTRDNASSRLTLALLMPFDGSFGFETNAAAATIAASDAQTAGLLKDFDIRIIWGDDRCDGKTALGTLVYMKEVYDIDAVIGLPCSTAAMLACNLASYWNLPVFSFAATNSLLSDKQQYTTLARLMSPFNHLAVAVNRVLDFFSWGHIVMVDGGPTDGECSYITMALQKQFASSAVDVTETIRVPVDFLRSDLAVYLDRIKTSSRIVVMCGPEELTTAFMLVALDKDMTMGDYVYIITYLFKPENLVKPWIVDGQNNEQTKGAFKPVLQLGLPYPSDQSAVRFMDGIPEAMRRSPWYYNRTLETGQKGSPYSLYLYDSVYLWSLAADNVINSGNSPRNGTSILQAAINSGFQGRSGFVRMDDNADRIADYKVWHLSPEGEEYSEFLDVRLLATNESNPVVPTAVRYWGPAVGYIAPKDIPLCGFSGDSCPQSGLVRNAVIIGFASLIVLATGCSLAGFYIKRRKRFEERMEEMSWKIKSEDIHFIRRDFNNSSKTVGTGASSQSSYPLLNVPPAESTFKSVRAAYCRELLCAVKPVKSTVITLSRQEHIELLHMREIIHDNLCVFVGLCLDPGSCCILTKFCLRGSLLDILINEEIKVDDTFKRSFMFDIIQGLDFLHKSPIKCHGRLKSTNCLVDSRWVVKLNSWGLSSFHQQMEHDNEEEYYRSLLWTAPELLNHSHSPANGTQAGDIYSLGIIFYEILHRCPPFMTNDESIVAKDIVNRVKLRENPPFRPSILSGPDGVERRYVNLIMDCWTEDETTRPNTGAVRNRFALFNRGKRINIMDNMLRMMEKYANNLEEVIGERTRQLVEEKKKADSLLYRMLPPSVADSLKLGLSVHPELYKEVTIYFSDIVSFTTLASESSPMEVVDFLNDLWTTFDDIINKYNVYKIETIGDAYMVVSGLPKPYANHAPEMANMSLSILAAVKTFKIRHRPNKQLEIRIGMHSGPVVAGVVGQTMPRYCLFGDTVNMASRMESHGEPIRIHISEECYKFLIKSPDEYIVTLRGETNIKGKGMLTTYWLEGRRQVVY